MRTSFGTIRNCETLNRQPTMDDGRRLPFLWIAGRWLRPEWNACPSCCQVVLPFKLFKYAPPRGECFVAANKQLLQQFVKPLSSGRPWLCSALNLFIINAFACYLPWAGHRHLCLCSLRSDTWTLVPSISRNPCILPGVPTPITLFLNAFPHRWSMVDARMLLHATAWTTTVLYRFLWAVNMNVFSILPYIHRVEYRDVEYIDIYIYRNIYIHWQKM